MLDWLRAALVSVAALTATDALAQSVTVLEFEDLRGWAEDDHGDALAVFQETCGDLRDPDWQTLCKVSDNWADAKRFFELHFRPVLIEDGTPMLFTGYYEPELRGAKRRGGPYQFPLYRVPEGEQARLTRAEIEENQVFDGQGLEIAWLSDPVDAYFLQVQGSGRVKLIDGPPIRVGYGDKNGHEYRSIGKELIRRGIFEEHEVSADRIRDWVSENGEEGRRLLHHNPSYVYFREVNQVPADRGPLGAMNRSITPMRSLAVDPAYTPLGAPVWIEAEGAEPIRRLMVAQDTGGAIKGAQRADIFVGTGPAAGKRAGEMRDGGRMVVLLPIGRAYAMAEPL